MISETAGGIDIHCIRATGYVVVLLLLRLLNLPLSAYIAGTNGALLTCIVYHLGPRSRVIVYPNHSICNELLQFKAVIVKCLLNYYLVTEIVSTRTRQPALQCPRPKFTSWNSSLTGFRKSATAGIEPTASRHHLSDARVTN